MAAFHPGTGHHGRLSLDGTFAFGFEACPAGFSQASQYAQGDPDNAAPFACTVSCQYEPKALPVSVRCPHRIGLFGSSDRPNHSDRHGDRHGDRLG